MNLSRIFNRNSDQNDLDFNDPFDQWLRATIAKEMENIEAPEYKAVLLEGFHLKMDEHAEARKNRHLNQE